MWKYRDIFFITFLTAAGLIPLLRVIAFRFNILDHPKSHGIHSHPVPRIGGVAIFVAFVVGTLYRMDLSDMLKGILVGSTIMFITGLLDDIIHLRAIVRLMIQLIACSIMMFRYGVVLDVFPNIYLNAFFTTLGLIGITNAVNFLDNMDGLASGLVMISSFSVCYLSFLTEQFWLGYLSLALSSSCLGFLIFNIRPAYIFMGDAGSTFLGFTLASLCVMSEWSHHVPNTIASALLVLGVPILDMFLITILRSKEGKVRNFKQWIDYAGKDHFSHRLMRLGLGKNGAVLCLWALQTFFCTVALWIVFQNESYGWMAFAGYGIVTLSVIFLFRKKRHIVLKLKGRVPKTSRKKKASSHRLAKSSGAF